MTNCKNGEELLDKMIDMAIESYKKVYGADKWNGLTEEEKNIVVHKIVMDFAEALNRI